MNKFEDFDWNDKACIASRIQGEPRPDEDKILQYLKSGNLVAVYMTVIYDCFNPEIKTPIKVLKYTDLEWDWDTPLIYYVEKYHYKISDEFYNHMKAKDWKVHQFTKKEISERKEQGGKVALKQHERFLEFLEQYEQED